jgi:hypothetical protein
MQITRFFKQGYSIIETGNDEVLAAINPEKTELVVAIVNKSEEQKPFNLKLNAGGKSGKEMVIYRTDIAENCERIPSSKVKNQAISYNAPGQSLTTFVISLGK